MGAIYTTKPNSVVNVKDFGAKGDGVTNDAAAIMAAANFASASGLDCYSPAGTYYFGNTQFILPPCNYTGDGMYATVWSSTVSSTSSGTGCPAAFNPNSSTTNLNCIFNDMALETPQTSGTYTCTIGFNCYSQTIGIVDQQSGGFTMNRCRLVGCSSALNVRTDQNHLSPCTIVLNDCIYISQDLGLGGSMYVTVGYTIGVYWPLQIFVNNTTATITVDVNVNRSAGGLGGQIGETYYNNYNLTMILPTATPSGGVAYSAVTPIYSVGLPVSVVNGGSLLITGGAAPSGGGTSISYAGINNNANDLSSLGIAGQYKIRLLFLSSSTSYQPSLVRGYDWIYPMSGAGSDSLQTDVGITTNSANCPGFYIGQCIWDSTDSAFHTCTSPSSVEFIIATASGTGAINGGNFVIQINGQQTSNIAYNASAATVLAAILALPCIGGVSVSGLTVTGSNGGPWTVTIPPTVASGPYTRLYPINVSLTTSGTSPGVGLTTFPWTFSGATWTAFDLSGAAATAQSNAESYTNGLLSETAITLSSGTATPVLTAKYNTVTLTANTTVAAPTGTPSTDPLTVLLLQTTQDSTGGRTIAFATGSYVLSSTLATVATTAGAIALYGFKWDSSLSKLVCAGVQQLSP
jgi:hypothetical protein